MVPSNDYSLDIERENEILILYQEFYISGNLDVLGKRYPIFLSLAISLREVDLSLLLILYLQNF